MIMLVQVCLLTAVVPLQGSILWRGQCVAVAAEAVVQARQGQGAGSRGGAGLLCISTTASAAGLPFRGGTLCEQPTVLCMEVYLERPPQAPPPLHATTHVVPTARISQHTCMRTYNISNALCPRDMAPLEQRRGQSALVHKDVHKCSAQSRASALSGDAAHSAIKTRCSCCARGQRNTRTQRENGGTHVHTRTAQPALPPPTASRARGPST
jgi:hypothetical protein